MHNKDACSPSSNGRFGATASGQMPSPGGVYGSLYSALSNENIPSLSANCSNGGGVSLYPYSEPTQYDSCVIQKHQDMVNRHSMCLSRLVETSKEVEALKQENGQLRAANKELQKQLHLVIQASLENQYGGSSGQPQATLFDVVHGFRGLHVGEGKENCADWNNNNNHNHNNIINNNNNNKELQEISDESPTSVIENNVVEVERFSLPKSISVRSNGYLKIAQSQSAALATNNNASRNRGATRPRTSSTPPEAVQKVYVRGGQKEEEPLEMIVYNQGMFKTELCNKWQETGTCPYGDHCQFAHGIGELRPVIRHPRYKTEVCRMVLAGVVCPYGHRCHFRHALTEQEKAVVSQPKPRTMKLER
ncbi:Zinc finger CCCH domain-containing protein 15, partial [Mucuna pruriens]